jgi:tetratricopeptide (TPR) repeat protein
MPEKPKLRFYLEATLALGQLFESSERRDKAQRLYQAYQEKFGPSSAVAEDLARIFLEAKDYTRAFDQFTIIESSDPGDINIKAKMAFILIEQQRFQDAIVKLESVLALEPTSDKIRFYLGAVYEELKDYNAAVSNFQKVPIGSSYYAESVIHASYLLKLQGDYPKAIATIEAGIKAKDDHPPFYALYASLLDDLKQYGRAVTMLTEAVKKVPDQAQLYFFLGNMHDRLGHRDETVASMKHVLDLDKDHVQALNFLAYLYADSGSKLDDAEKMARRALELQPEDGYILDTLGWVIFKRGRVPEAIRVLEAAYKIQPNEAVIAEHLGDAYYQNQMPEKAKKLYMRATETESNVAILEKIRTKIAAVDRQIQAFGDDSARKPASTRTH